MNTIQNKFTDSEWQMIIHILKNGKTGKWFDLAVMFNIRPDGSYTQRLKSANDVWRKYRKLTRTVSNTPKILIYDIETSRVEAGLWWSGKQYVNGNQLRTEPKIITIAYKWLGDSTVTCLKWDENQSDEKMMKVFLEIYNQADMIVGYNNHRFDDKFINTRAMKYNLDVNTNVKSFDIMKQSKKLFRLPSYSMNYLAKFVGVETKLQHSGLEMWENIQYGNPKEAKEAMDLMVEYNMQDIVVTEQVYLRVRKYMKNPIHLGALYGKDKTTSPITGSNNVSHYKMTTTSAGTIQHIMVCNETGAQFKISHTQFLKLNE